MPFVLDSFARLKREADIVLVEGAGSASEINLRANDIANMGFARAADVPVVLIGDIDRGGVIASLVGTKAVIDADDAALINGFLVNKFRGDPALFADGMALIAAATGWEPLGLVPLLRRSARCCRRRMRSRSTDARPRQDRSAHQDRRSAPAAHRQFRRSRSARRRARPSSWCGCGRATRCRATPISSSCRAPRRPSPTSPRCAQAGFDIDIVAHLRRGGRVLGLCGGYQMLGRAVHDPDGIEGRAGNAQPGLVCSMSRPTLAAEKRLEKVAGSLVRRRALRGLRDAYGR